VKILSHRGYWKAASEKNTAVAFHRSFSLGFGTETDVRDCAGRLVISHDAPLGNEMTFETFLGIYSEYDRTLPLALNIKSDGIAQRMASVLVERDIVNWFTFDMSVPDAITQLKAGIPAFLRRSEYEPESVLEEDSPGIWLDAFKSCWYTSADVEGYLQRGKTVCMVSPDLHKREPTGLWARLKGSAVVRHDKALLCTDLPEDAIAYF
jgi:hypothetical protein